MVSRLASGGVVWQGHQHSISNVHRREKVDRRRARGSSRCLTLLWWLTRKAGRHIAILSSAPSLHSLPLSLL